MWMHQLVGHRSLTAVTGYCGVLVAGCCYDAVKDRKGTSALMLSIIDSCLPLIGGTSGADLLCLSR
jgi:hypothetical protein